jgi:ubiquinone/menaquinone biosynthesis C-methylase UbiE
LKNTLSLTAREEDRIRAAYARRRNDLGRYSLFNSGHLFFIQERERQVLAVLKRSGVSSLESKSILEIGCGKGDRLREFLKWGARPENVVGVDLLPDRVAEARRVCPEGVRIECQNAEKLVFPSAAFDLVFQFTVFTSILDVDVKREIAAEMLRVVKPDGLILWHDYHVNNPRNLDVQGVKKREILQLFPGCRIELQRVTLVPPLVRLIGRYSWLACYLLGRIPLFCTHYLGVIRKTSPTNSAELWPTI